MWLGMSEIVRFQRMLSVKDISINPFRLLMGSRDEHTY